MYSAQNLIMIKRLLQVYVFTVLYFYHCVRVSSFYLQGKKFAVKQYAVLHQQQPRTSRVYCLCWLHHFCARFNRMLVCILTYCIGWWPRSNSLHRIAWVCSRLDHVGLCTCTLMFAQWQNRIAPHFSEHIPIIGWHMTAFTMGEEARLNEVQRELRLSNK